MNNNNFTTRYTNNNYNLQMDQHLHSGQNHKFTNFNYVDNYNMHGNQKIKASYQNTNNIQFD